MASRSGRMSPLRSRARGWLIIAPPSMGRAVASSAALASSSEPSTAVAHPSE